jgi:hypothetical protein
VIPAAPNLIFESIYLSVDSAGYPWIGYTKYDGSHRYPFVIASSKNDGTWTNARGFPYQLSTASTTWRISVIPLTSRKMLAVYSVGSSTIRVKRWDGTFWGSERATASKIVTDNYYSASAQGDDVHLVYLSMSPHKILYTNYTYTRDAWQTSETTIQTSVSSTTAPVLSYDSVSNDLYVFWLGSPAANHVYYKKRSYGIWEADPTDWVSETTTLTSTDSLRAFYSSYSRWIGLSYTTGTRHPYIVRFVVMNAVGGSETVPEFSSAAVLVFTYFLAVVSLGRRSRLPKPVRNSC